MGSQQFCLKWNNHQSNMLTVFEQLLSNEALVDVTLACEGLSLKAHKMVLSACSPFFQALFVENPCKHPIVILKDMRYVDLKAIVEFMYRGEVNVSQDQLSALLKTAETLKVKGLAEVTGENRQGLVPLSEGGDAKGTPESPPLSKRKRGRPRRRSPSDSNKSDSEDGPTRVKGAPDSPEIIEDGSSLSSDRLAAPSPAKTSKATVGSTSTTTTAGREPVVDSVVDDVDGSPEDADFEVDASNLMEQSMTTENVPVFSDVASSSRLGESQTHPAGTSQESSAAPLLPASLPSDISVSTQDMKPLASSLIPFEEPTISPVVQQQSADGSLLFLDSSGVPAVAGPSNYHPDKQPSTPSHGGQHLPRLPAYSRAIWSIIPGSRQKSAPHRRPPSSPPKTEETDSFSCTFCSKAFKARPLLKQHLSVHMENSLSCKHCGAKFRWRSTRRNHIRKYHESPLDDPKDDES